MHEVVLQNRLEQLRVRQREDALKVQSDIAAQVTHAAGRAAPRGGNIEENELEDLDDEEEQLIEEDLLDAYSDEMAPELFHPSKLSYEDKQVPVVDELEEKRKLVSRTSSSSTS